ncbi:MAG: DUF1569 domain-containing protein [Silvibacterium sp.]|nr:DUF1569 domain-containing protein [Silvibacterium sp.]
MHAMLEDLHQSYRKRLAGKDLKGCQIRPARALRGNSEAWTTQEVIEHLLLTYRSTVALFDRYLSRNSPSQQPVTTKHRLLQFLVIRCGGFPRGVSAPEQVRPGKTGLPPMSGEELANCLRAELEAMDAKIEKCREAFGSRPLAPHFAFGPLTADQWRRFHFVHGRHHLKQLDRIRKQTANTSRS